VAIVPVDASERSSNFLHLQLLRSRTSNFIPMLGDPQPPVRTH